MINIYCLVDPRNNKPFYVGATKRELNKRLESHIWAMNANCGEGVMSIRKRLFKELKVQGLKPEIKLLATVLPEYSDNLEIYFYTLFISQGIDLLQSKHRFFYQNRYYCNIVAIIYLVIYHVIYYL